MVEKCRNAKLNPREIFDNSWSAKLNPREIFEFRGWAEPRNLIPAKIYPIKVFQNKNSEAEIM